MTQEHWSALLAVAERSLVGVETDWIGFAFGSPCTGDLCGAPWWIRWTNPEADPVELVTGSCTSDYALISFVKFTPLNCQMDLQTTTIADNVTFTRVPEPGTLLLVAGGRALLKGFGI